MQVYCVGIICIHVASLRKEIARKINIIMTVKVCLIFFCENNDLKQPA